MTAFLICSAIVASIALPCVTLVALASICAAERFGRRMAWAFRGWKPVQQQFITHCDFDEVDEGYEGRIDPSKWGRG